MGMAIGAFVSGTAVAALAVLHPRKLSVFVLGGAESEQVAVVARASVDGYLLASLLVVFSPNLEEEMEGKAARSLACVSRCVTGRSTRYGGRMSTCWSARRSTWWWGLSAALRAGILSASRASTDA